MATSSAPLAKVTPEQFIAMDSHIRTPTGIAATGTGNFYVASVFNAVIAEYDAQGNFVREILRPASGDKPLPEVFKLWMESEIHRANTASLAFPGRPPLTKTHALRLAAGPLPGS